MLCTQYDVKIKCLYMKNTPCFGAYLLHFHFSSNIQPHNSSTLTSNNLAIFNATRNVGSDLPAHINDNVLRDIPTFSATNPFFNPRSRINLSNGVSFMSNTSCTNFYERREIPVCAIFKNAKWYRQKFDKRPYNVPSSSS